MGSVSRLLLILAVVSLLIGLTALVFGESILERIKEVAAGGTTERSQLEGSEPTSRVESAESSTTPTAIPTPEIVLEAAPEPQQSILGEDMTFVQFDHFLAVYPTLRIFDAHQGTLALWMSFPQGYPQRDYNLFSTDDSRFVLYIDSYTSSTSSEEIVRIAARAGGNQRAIDSDYELGNFPEVSIIIDNDSSLDEQGDDISWYGRRAYPEDEWHHLAMTWDGYPFGTVRIFFDGLLVAEKPYDPRYDDGRPLAHSLAIGFRPPFSIGDLVEGIEEESFAYTPDSYLQFDLEAPSIGDLYLYKTALTSEQVIRVMMEETGE